MIRAIYTLITGVIVTLLASVMTLVTSIFGAYSPGVNFSARFWTKSILFAAGAKLEIEGLEKLDLNHNYIFIGNHQSHFDVFAVFSILPVTVRFMAKKELFRIPIFGWALTSSGSIKIDRSNHEKSIKSMNEALKKIKQGVSVAIFPEGTRSEDGKIGTFKKGGFVLAAKGGIPIVPFTISGSRFILRKHSLRVYPGKIKIIFSDPVQTENCSYQDRDKLSAKVRDIIISNYDENYNESPS
ncbi:MAG: 1-acyl-sn-glycerol-3-phosphate acyltransferase [Calditrichales bacterium]|nr:MAG: 1-acyl-sn-glycerol-3-phosphate acyltransferase [Calditrichales bacterium]